MRGVLAPLGSWSSATVRRDYTDLLVRLPLNRLINSFWSFGLTSILSGGRRMPPTMSQDTSTRKWFLELLQVVTDLAVGMYSLSSGSHGAFRV
jgi:hypothetical protein